MENATVDNDPDHFQKLSMIYAGLYFLTTVYLWSNFDSPSTAVNTAGFHYIINSSFLAEYGFNLSFGVNGISMNLLLLTGYLMPLCVYGISIREENYRLKVFYMYTVFLALTFCFITTNMFYFFVFFESLLIPMILVIGL